MAEEFDTVTIPELDNLTVALTSYFATSNLNGKLGKATVADFVTFITPYIKGVGASGFVPVTGTVLPVSPSNSFSLVTAGTYTQTTGGNVVTTSVLNLLVTNGTTWSLVKAIDLPGVVTDSKLAALDKLNSIQFAPNNSIVISDGAAVANVQITISSLVTVYDAQRGVRSIDPVTITVPNDNFVILSSNAASFVQPDLTVAGAGLASKLFLLPISFDDFATFSTFKNNLYIVGVAKDKYWTPLIPAFSGLKTADVNATFTDVRKIETLNGVVFGPKSSIKITENASTVGAVTVELTAALLVYGGMGTIRTIDAAVLTVPNDAFLVVSKSASAYVDPDLKNYSLNTDKLFLFPIQFNNAMFTSGYKPGLVIVGLARGGKWNAKFPAFSSDTSDIANIKLAESITSVQIAPKTFITITESASSTGSVTIQVTSQLIVYNALGSIRLIDPATVVVPQDYILLLSANATTYVDPVLQTKGNNTEKLFLLPLKFDNTLFAFGFRSGIVVLGVARGGKWNALNPSFLGGGAIDRSYLDSRWIDYEIKNFLQKRNEINSPIEDKIKPFVTKQRLKRQDVTIVMFDGSVSTDMGYASKRTDAAYRPPICTENNIPSFIEEKLRWKEQQFRRYDSMTDQGGATASFTEVGTGTTTDIDAAWDWQLATLATSGYYGLTRILTGANPAVSYQFRATHRRCDFIFRTDYLSSASLKVTIGSGSGLVTVFDESTSTWVEANNYIFSAKETNTVINAVNSSYNGSTTLRKSIYQKRLKMKSVDISGDKTVTITSQDGGRLCYWGITYSPKEYMFQFIDNARGSHNIAMLTNFEAWSVDYWKPDLIIYPLNTINEGASYSNASLSPTTLADRFEAYITKMKAKSYAPEVFSYIQFTSATQSPVNTLDVVNTGFITGYGETTTYDYMDALFERIRSLPIASVSMFNEYMRVAKIKATYNGTTMYTEMFTNGGNAGTSFTVDQTHLNDYGAMIGWRFLEKYFNF